MRSAASSTPETRKQILNLLQSLLRAGRDSAESASWQITEIVTKSGGILQGNLLHQTYWIERSCGVAESDQVQYAPTNKK